jgi:hypothetical protein
MSGKAALTDLGNAISDAIHDAMVGGLEADEAASVVVQIAADYWRAIYGPETLPGLASLVVDRAKQPLPADISRN